MVLMAGDTTQQIKDKLSITDVVSEYVKLERSGTNMRARCPFHAERTPSFFVSPERGTYHCFGCDKGGDIFSFVQEIEGLDFKGALKVLADKAGVKIVYGRGGKEGKDERGRLFELLETATIFYTSRLTTEAKKYLKERGITEATVKTFRLGWAGDGWSEVVDHLKSKEFSEKEILDAGVGKKSERGSVNDKFRNRIMFPIADSAGRVVGFSGRVFGEKASPEAPKYLNSPETPLFHKSRILYGFDKAKLTARKHNCAILVEGQLDLLASHQAGWSNTIAVSGTAFTPEHAALIKRLTDNLVIALDADEAGIKAAGRAARAALQQGLNVKVARLPNGLDPADLVLKEGKEKWSAAIRNAKDIITFLLDVLEERSKGVDGFRRNVEIAVLPYVNDVASPIAREMYQREIAKRLGVSESAVSEALSRMPKVPASEGSAVIVIPTPSAKSERVAHAFSILLWLREQKKPLLDLDAYEKELREAVGADAYKRLEALSKGEQEKLRFGAEQMYATSKALKAEAKTLLAVLLKERLTRELREATVALKKAEERGNEKEVGVHMSVCNVLTKQIASLHEVL
jgi:DNA primase